MATVTSFIDDRFPHLQIRWHGGATFCLWTEGAIPHYHTENGWTEFDCFTHYGQGGTGDAPNPIEAAEAAEAHFNKLAEE
jgi:hypothetical protein